MDDDLLRTLYLPRFTFEVQLPQVHEDMLVIKKRKLLFRVWIQMRALFVQNVAKLKMLFLKRKVENRIKYYLDPPVVVMDRALTELQLADRNLIELMEIGSSLCLPVQN